MLVAVCSAGDEAEQADAQEREQDAEGRLERGGEEQRQRVEDAAGRERPSDEASVALEPDAAGEVEPVDEQQRGRDPGREARRPDGGQGQLEAGGRRRGDDGRDDHDERAGSEHCRMKWVEARCLRGEPERRMADGDADEGEQLYREGVGEPPVFADAGSKIVQRCKHPGEKCREPADTEKFHRTGAVRGGVRAFGHANPPLLHMTIPARGEECPLGRGRAHRCTPSPELIRRKRERIQYSA